MKKENNEIDNTDSRITTNEEAAVPKKSEAVSDEALDKVAGGAHAAGAEEQQPSIKIRLPF